MDTILPVEKAVSAGGIVYKFNNDGLSILLCGRREGNMWGLPKGTPDAGETLEQTASREITEETGLKGTLQDKIGEIHYWFTRKGIRYNKTVHFYIFSPTGGAIEDHDPEFDFVSWFLWEDALNKLTYKDEIAIVKQAIEALRIKNAAGEKTKS